ncbi:MAG: hypothetical protein PWP71_936 [Clostridia bacterium]|nr:hypothetical protein [Clostridia bacterium]
MSVISIISELIFPTPKICPLCYTKLEKLEICTTCNDKLQYMKVQAGQCLRCGTFGIQGNICDNCRSWPQYIHFNVAAVPYEKEYREILHLLKFKKQGWIIPALIQLMKNSLPQENYDLVIPVPLHKNRLNQRGFNQSALLAQALAKELKIKYMDKVLLRKIDTPHQTSLPRSKRHTNLINAFTVSNEKIIKNKSILLVDDVITSGATLWECAKTLHKAGAKKIYCTTFAAGIV